MRRLLVIPHHSRNVIADAFTRKCTRSDTLLCNVSQHVQYVPVWLVQDHVQYVPVWLVQDHVQYVPVWLVQDHVQYVPVWLVQDPKGSVQKGYKSSFCSFLCFFFQVYVGLTCTLLGFSFLRLRMRQSSSAFNLKLCHIQTKYMEI